MTTEINRRVVLASRPKGVPDAGHFRVEDVPVTAPVEGEVLVRTRYWSVDPAMRGWVNDAPNYLPPVEIGAVMRSFAVGEVVDSRDPAYAPGDIVTGRFGWQRFATVAGAAIDRKVTETDRPQSYALGILGLNGVTAYFGLLEVCAAGAGQWASPEDPPRRRCAATAMATMPRSTTSPRTWPRRWRMQHRMASTATSTTHAARSAMP
jgi:NADPH-dependent curcumin reductase CurA